MVTWPINQKPSNESMGQVTIRFMSYCESFSTTTLFWLKKSKYKNANFINKNIRRCRETSAGRSQWLNINYWLLDGVLPSLFESLECGEPGVETGPHCDKKAVALKMLCAWSQQLRKYRFTLISKSNAIYLFENFLTTAQYSSFDLFKLFRWSIVSA